MNRQTSSSLNIAEGTKGKDSADSDRRRFSLKQLRYFFSFSSLSNGVETLRSTHMQRLVFALASHTRSIVVVLLSSLALSLLGLATPRITQAVLDRVVPTGDRSLLASWIAALGLVMAFQVVLGVVRRLLLVNMSLEMDRVVLGDFCRHLLSLPLDFFRAHKTGDLVARFQDHVNVRHLLAGSLTRVVIDVVMVTVYVAVMFSYSSILALLVVGILLLLFVFTFYLTPIMKRSHRRMLENSAAHEAQLVELITAIDLVKALGVEEEMQNRWKGAFSCYLRSNSKTQQLKQILESGGAAIQFLSVLVVLWYGATLVMMGTLTIGELVAFSMYASQAVAPVLGLLTLWDEVQQARASLDRIEEVRRQSSEQISTTSVSPLSASQAPPSIELDNVSFAYDSGSQNWVLRNVSFTVKAGECIAIVGKSGSGKTTLARILLGLLLPTEGRVLVDGIDVQDMDLPSYRRQLGIVLQESLLLSGSIRENITIGHTQICAERLLTSLRFANLDNFVANMPSGTDTPIAEMGSTLSGGQRQRIALARAFYRDPRIFILDEPTSNLDETIEAKIVYNLKNAMKNRTAIIFSHSQRAIALGNQVIYLERLNAKVPR